jgi:hypothetical protein
MQDTTEIGRFKIACPTNVTSQTSLRSKMSDNCYSPAFGVVEFVWSVN